MVALDSLHGGLMSQQNSFELISPCSINEQVLDLSSYPGSPETETYEVELRKNVYGMGIKSNQMINNIDYTIFFFFLFFQKVLELPLQVFNLFFIEFTNNLTYRMNNHD